MQDKLSLERREFLKTSAKFGTVASLASFSGFALSACNSNSTQNIEKIQNIQGDTMKTNLTPKAKQTFEKLFDSTDVPLAKSDPEFFTNYVNFAFDEVPTESKLELKESLMITLASLVAIPALSEFKIILKATLKNGVEPVAIKEILYQATPYVGMGKVLDFISATNEIFMQQ
ncbi:carboxymuconolactone decarboxylase family protein [Helicobacter apodemus]|uniref:carboxymuconolactone decarboxylase family protein n=1 Tax=Helicobacter apodemus TaxID=135569 RepID=UPI001EF30569|nr:carboxymuconolactone decarboxylase family protein [Helicobacter apodemus]